MRGVVSRRPGHTAIAGALLSVATVTALLTSPLAASATPRAHPTISAASAAATGAENVAAESAGAAASSCASPSSVAATAGTRTTPAAGLGEDDPLGTVLLQLLGRTAVTFAVNQGFGWVLNLLGGGQPKLDPAEINAQFDQVNTKLDALGQQQYADCTAVLAALQQAQNTTDKDAYTNLVSPMSTQIGYLVTYQNAYDNVVAALSANGGHVDRLSSTNTNAMRDMISDGTTGLPSIIDQMNVLESASQPGAKSMIPFYSQVLSDELGYDPYTSHIFPAGFVVAGYAQQGYYAALVSQAVYLYANVEHLTFTADAGYKHVPDSGAIITLVNRAQADIHTWSSLFSDGLGGSWVGQGNNLGLGVIPADTEVDYRDRHHPQLWTATPVSVTGTVSPYCASTAEFCYADRYDGLKIGPLSAWALGATRRVRPSAAPLTTLVTSAAHDGLDDWRIPTTKDWTTLEAGATGGLSTWGPASQLPQFTATTATSHVHGVDHPLTTIDPLLVNTGTVDSPTFGLLSTLGAAANTLSLIPSHLPASDTQDAIAGQLFLTRDFTATGPPTPFTIASTGIGRRTAAAPPVRGRTDSQAVVRAETPDPVRALESRTFTTPTRCGPKSSYVVPDGVGSVTITAVGAAGADGLRGGATSALAGIGEVVTETIPATSGNVLYVQVGGAGHGSTGGVGGGGGGGPTNSGGDPNDLAGGGGGSSGVSTTANCSRWLVVGGGGGGGGAGIGTGGKTLTLNGGRGGGGCAAVADPCLTAAAGSYAGPATGGGAGGSQPNSSGGAAGNSQASAGAGGTTQLGGDGGGAGGSTGGGGGGGGGGYFGGGGGGGAGANSAGGGGGGGGASFAIAGGSDESHRLGVIGSAGSVTITPNAKVRMPISLVANSTSPHWDQPLTLTATAPADATGDVGFYDDINGGCENSTDPGAVCQGEGVAPLVDGVATLTAVTVALGIGVHHLHVSTVGDLHYLANDSATVDVTVAQATPAMTLTVSGTRLPSGQTPTSVVVQVPTDLTDTISFHAGDQLLGTAVAADGYAFLTTVPVLPDGGYTMTATSDGDTHYTTATSNPVAVSIGLQNAPQPSPLTAYVTKRTGPGLVAVSGTAIPRSTVTLHAQPYGHRGFSTVATQVAGAAGTYRFTPRVTRTTRYYVSTVDGVRSTSVTAAVAALVTESLTAGHGTVSVTVRTAPAVHAVMVTFYRVNRDHTRTPLRDLWIGGADGVVSARFAVPPGWIVLQVWVHAGDGTTGGVSRFHTTRVLH